MTEKKLSRLPLILPFVLFALFFVGYTLVWKRGASEMRAEIAAFAEAERAAGRSFAYEGIDVAGYPFTLRGTVNGVSWESPVFGRFTSEEVTIATLPYDVSRIVFAPMGEMALTAGGRTYDLEADDLRFSLESDFVAMEGHGAVLTGEAGTIRFDDLIANARRTGGGTAIAVSLRQLRLGDEETVRIPFFDMAASRQGRTLTIAAVDAGLGRESDTAPTQLAGKGALSADEGGILSGEVELRFKNEGPVIGILTDAGIIDQGAAGLVEGMLSMMTEAGTKEVVLPVTVDSGVLSLGAVPLTTLPAFDL